MKRPWNTKAIERPYIQKKQEWGVESDNYAFYNSRQWRNFVKFYWSQHARECKVCGKYADILDHITPINKGGDKLSETNVQGLCYRHHQAKHNKERGRNAK